MSQFDGTEFACAHNRQGFLLRPKQCSRCRLIFTPESAEQTECEKCMGAAPLTKEKTCGRCNKPFAPTSNGQKFCPACIPLNAKDQAAKYRAARGAVPRKIIAVQPPLVVPKSLQMPAQRPGLVSAALNMLDEAGADSLSFTACGGLLRVQIERVKP